MNELEYVWSEARDWIADAFTDAPADLSEEQIFATVARHYEGGWQGFLTDNSTHALVTR